MRKSLRPPKAPTDAAFRGFEQSGPNIEEIRSGRPVESSRFECPFSQKGGKNDHVFSGCVMMIVARPPYIRG